MKSLRNILPLLCAVNLLLFMMLAQHWWLGALVGLLIGGAFYLTCLPAPALAAAAVVSEPVAATAELAPEGMSRLAALLQRVLPAWQGNVQLARSQTQAAIDNLTSRFGGIHDRLRSAIDGAQGGRNAEALEVIQSAAGQLGELAGALEGVSAARQALGGKLELLAEATDEIRRLAQENEQLAGQTGVTDLFGDERSWQELAARSAENSRQIMLRAKAVRQQVLGVMEPAAPAASSIIAHPRAVIDQVVADFRQWALKLGATVDQLEAENREVDREICEILVNLQFQDRISQILDHVQRDIARLREASAQDPLPPLPTPEQWLQQLQQTYTTQEQRQLHAGAATMTGAQSQVDFF